MYSSAVRNVVIVVIGSSLAAIGISSLVNRPKFRNFLVEAKFKLAKEKDEACAGLLDNFIRNFNDEYKSVVKKCTDDVTFQERVSQLSINIIANKENPNVTELKPDLDDYMKRGSLKSELESFSADKEKLQNFCTKANQLKISSFSNYEQLDFDWLIYLKMCVNSELFGISFWTGK